MAFDMAATPLTDRAWDGLPLLECVMDPGRYELYMQVPRLILRRTPGTRVEVFGRGGGRVAFRQAPLRFDLFGPGMDIVAVSDRVATQSLVVALPAGWLPAEDEAAGDALPLRPRFQFADAVLRRLVWRLAAYHQRGAPLGAGYSRAVSRSIVDRVVTLQSGWAAGSDGLDDEARRVVTALVDGRLHESLTVPWLAARVGMSLSTFARRFRASFHATPHQYIRERRLDRARQMLDTTDASLTTIALETGFASHAHFTTAFRAANGLTPSEYRQCAARRQPDVRGAAAPRPSEDVDLRCH